MIRNQKGMSLVEILITLTIIAIAGTLTVTAVTSRLKSAKIKQAKILISELSKGLDMYYGDCTSYPTTDQGLNALIEDPGADCPDWGPDPYLKKVPKDSWNKDFIYEEENGSYFLMSLGSDGREGGSGDAKDITNE